MATLIQKRNRLNLTLLLPAVIIVCIMLIFPLCYNFYLSLRDFNLYKGTNELVGFKLYAKLFTDPGFGTAILRNFLYVIVVVVANFVIGMGMALLLNTEFKGYRLFMGIIVAPMMLIPAAGATLWRFMYLTDFGLIPHILDFLGFTKVNFLSLTSTSIWAVMLTDIWSWTPMVFLILYGGLRSLPAEPTEAARIDGASSLGIIRFITIPLMMPVITIAITLKAIDTFKAFDYVWVMTRGGPGGSSHIGTTYAYEVAFTLYNYGYGSAISIVFTAITAIMASLLIILIMRRSSGS